MLSRRSMIRALGFGVPAAAVAAAVGLPELQRAAPAVAAVSPETQAGFWLFSSEGNPVIAPQKLSVADLEAITANMGQIVAGEIAARGPVAREMERAYGLRRSLA